MSVKFSAEFDSPEYSHIPGSWFGSSPKMDIKNSVPQKMVPYETPIGTLYGPQANMWIDVQQ